jgi:hypothetical protein
MRSSSQLSLPIAKISGHIASYGYGYSFTEVDALYSIVHRPSGNRECGRHVACVSHSPPTETETETKTTEWHYFFLFKFFTIGFTAL